MRFRICVSDIRYEVLGYVRKIMWFAFGVDGIGCDMRYEVFGMRSRYMQCVVCGIATRDMGYGARGMILEQPKMTPRVDWISFFRGCG